MGDGCEVAWAGDLGDQGDLINEERDTGDRQEGGGGGLIASPPAVVIVRGGCYFLFRRRREITGIDRLE